MKMVVQLCQNLAYLFNQWHSPTYLCMEYKCVEQVSVSERITILSSSTGIARKITCKRQNVKHKWHVLPEVIHATKLHKSKGAQ